MHDFAYAREVLEQARSSSDPRLVEYARYIEGRSRSPRIADKPSASDNSVADTVPGIQAAKTPPRRRLWNRVRTSFASGC